MLASPTTAAASGPAAAAPWANPGPAPRLPARRLLGHLHAVQQDPLQLAAQALATGHSAVRVRVAHLDVTWLLHPDPIARVLVDQADRYRKDTTGYTRLRTLLGAGLVTAEGEDWRRNRRVANPAFRRPNLEAFSRSMVAAAQALAAEWDAAAQARRAVDVGADLARMTLRIAGQTLFSLDLAGEAAEVGQALDLVLHHFGAHAADVFFLSPGVPTPGNVRYQRAVASLDDVVGRIVRERRAAGGSHEDLLGLLMDAQDSETGHRMDDRQLRDEVMTMLLAGHETTATALTWTLALLGRHPGERRRLEAEIDSVLQGRAPGPGDLRQLPVLDRVLRESLRLYPPVPALGRRANEDDVICGIAVKRGSDVYLWPWAAHRHPAIWTEPDAFDPDRWLDPKTPDGQPLPSHAWMPFSLGQRKCIGERFAMMEAALCLAVLVQGRRLMLPSGADLRPELLLTMRPRTRLWMGVQAR